MNPEDAGPLRQHLTDQRQTRPNLGGNMKAVRLYGPRDARLETLTEPEPGAGEVKIRIAAASLCGSELSVYEYFPLALAQNSPLI